MGVLEEFLGFFASSRESPGDVESWIVWLARVDARVTTVVICFTEWETQGGQGQKLYTDT